MEEFGNLGSGEKNRYWKMRLSKVNFFIGGQSLLYKLFWKILTLFMVIPLVLFAKYYSVKLRACNKNKKEEKDIMSSYRYFMDIYSGCVYSPFIKGRELELFKKCNVQEPILEIAIGDGYFSSLLFKSFDKKLTYGADLIYGTLKSAMKYNHCSNYIIMDAMQIPLPDNCIGTVIMNNLMHHLPDRSLVLKEVNRVLKDGGRFIFTENTMGWGIFSWEQVLLRKLKLYKLADYVLRLNLKLFAQSLLSDESFYEKKGSEMKFRVIRKVNFVSKTSMYIGSIFEFLNLKIGQPTRREMIEWINLFGFKNMLDKYMGKIIKYCHSKDEELVRTEGYAFQFYEIEKIVGSDLGVKYENTLISYVCPKCKKILNKGADSFVCGYCNIEYPVVDKIPIFIAYHNKIKGFHSYIEKKKKEESEEFVT